MAGPSADERIKRFLKRRAQESALAEVASQEHRKRERQEHDEREQQHEQIIERIKAKWTADVGLIAAILAELQAKLADEDLEVRFQDIGPSGDAIVRGLITGRFLGQPINVTLNVYADGIELHAGPTGGYFTEEFASTSKLSILNAGKGEYEALILDLLGID
jgi:hypothetical protein